MSDKDFRLVASDSSVRSPHDFNKMRIDGKIFRDDVTMRTSEFTGVGTKRFRITKGEIVRALENNDAKQLRTISNYFFVKSGIYSRLCRYMAYLYRYDWIITPIKYDDKVKDEKVIEG